MLFIENNLSYFITANNEDEFEEDKALFEDSRIPVHFETDVYADTDYWGLNLAEWFGYFRKMTLSETPDPEDIVLYESVPNSFVSR